MTDQITQPVLHAAHVTSQKDAASNMTMLLDALDLYRDTNDDSYLTIIDDLGHSVKTYLAADIHYTSLAHTSVDELVKHTTASAALEVDKDTQERQAG